MHWKVGGAFPNQTTFLRIVWVGLFNTIRWQTFFWAWIAPHLRHAFSESWWHVDYYSKVEKVGCQRFFFEKITGCLLQKTLRKILTSSKFFFFFWNFPKILEFIFLNPCLGTWEYASILKKMFFEASALMPQTVFWNFM